MRYIFPSLLLLAVFACPCLCDLLDRLDDCHRVAWNQSCPDTHCTYYFRDPGPYLTCCVCGPARAKIGFYYGVALLAAAVLLIYEMCGPPSPLCVVAAYVTVHFVDEDDHVQETQGSEKSPVIEV